MASRRYALVDGLRGLALVNMIVYHAIWDLVYLYGVDWSWYRDWPGALWQQAICWTFILVSGFCLPLSSHPYQRGMEVFLAGLAVTMVTLALMPQAIIICGVLTLLGTCMLIAAAARPLLARWARRPLPALLASLLLFLLLRPLRQGYLGLGAWTLCTLPESWYAGWLSTFLGLPMPGFFSADYFPLLPWLFLFLAGYFLYHLAAARGWLPRLVRSRCRWLEWCGRHSLLIYLLHQPVVFVLLRPFFPS